jgi:hypothetical protein
MSSHGTTVFHQHKITVNNDGANERIKRRQAATEEEKGCIEEILRTTLNGSA